MITQAVRLPVGGEMAGQAHGYVAELATDWRAVKDQWTGTGTSFQGSTWLGSWYGELASRCASVLLVTVRDAESREVAFRVPLVLRHEDGLRVIEFADLDLTDYNGPLLGPAAPTDRAGAVRAARALRSVLPPADLLRLVKMPPAINGRPNPLALHPAAFEGALNGNLIRMGEDYDEWRRSLGRTYRKELERSWRVFMRAGDASFDRITDPVEACSVMAELERQQGERVRSLGNAYALDDPDISRFYQTLVARGVRDGSVVVTALRAEGELVAALVGLKHASDYVMIRICQAGGRWSNCSPGRLVIERTLALLHAEGHRSFDFSIGNYDYKRRFETVRQPLFDYVSALGWRGVKTAVRARLVGHVRKYPRLDARLRVLQERFVTRPSGANSGREEA